MSLSFGTSTNSSIYNTQGFSSCQIDATHFAVVYGLTSSAQVVIVSVSGTTITWGTPSTFSAAALNDVPVVDILDSTHLVISYALAGGSNRGNAVVAVFSGTTISSYGTPVFWSPVTSINMARLGIVALDATHFIVCGSDTNNSQGIFKLGTVASGTVITYGTASVTNSGQIFSNSSPKLTKVNSTTFIATYSTATDRLITQVCTYSGTTLTMNTPKQIMTNNQTWCDVSLLDSTHFIIAYVDNSTCECYIATISGTSISLGVNNYTFYNNTSAQGRVIVLDSTHFVIFYLHGTGISDTIYGITGTVASTVISYDSDVSFPSPATTNPNHDGILTATFLDSIHVGVVWEYNTDSNMYGAVALIPVAPTVTTQAATSIALTTATGNGNVTADGGATISERGVCWDTSANPTTANSKATASGTTGAYTASITGLSGGTLYHYRAYAINSVGTSYGADTTFTTLYLPVVTTQSATLVSYINAIGNGNITDTGGELNDLRGVVYDLATHSLPGNVVPASSGYASKIEESGSFSTGAFTELITPLTASTTYYVRAYSHNPDVGYSYGNEVNFTTQANGKGAFMPLL